MPELPEVETIRVGLHRLIIGLTLQKIIILNPKTFQDDPELVTGKKVVNVWRKAKVLGIDLSDNLTLLFHLKMSGQVIYDSKKKRLAGGHPTQDMRDDMPNKSTRVIFEFNDDSVIYFNDQRKFGWIKIMPTDKVSDLPLLKTIGPEPLEKEFTWELLKTNLLKHKSLPVKVGILDQSAIGGVGNIYACEACFIAKLDPRIKVSQLTDSQFKSLHKGIIQSLGDGVKYGGSSRTHYVNSEGGKGTFLDYAFVYNRQGGPCKICQTPIEKIKLGGRGTYFCPRCQKI